MYVALGDSFTEGLKPGQPRWPAELARALGGRYVNLASVGATSKEVEQEQLERALELKPDVVTLVCGANDVLVNTRPDPEAYAASLSRMFARLRRELPHVQIVTATYPDISRFRERARAGLQRAREELVEARVVGDVGVGRFAHVDTVLAHEPADQPCGARAAAARRDEAGEMRQRPLGQRVLV